MSAEVYLTASAPGLTTEQVRQAVLSQPQVRALDEVIHLGEARMTVEEADPGEIWIDLLNHDGDNSEEAFRAFDSVYAYLAQTTSWDLWTGYDDVPTLCERTGVTMKHRPLLARAS
ncbi:hypothetical protein V5S96_01655 [Corynebacterium mastitidis]|uniref:Uncharacterized protein n=1 Tax=Corynebacterium mastitidis TaxID=161890 RepID=A0ABU8NVR3_9CORY